MSTNSFSNRRLGSILLTLALVTAILPRSALGQTTDHATLQARVAENPDDVDLRLRLARWLAWDGQYEASEMHTRKVLQNAPEYWDAYLLLARLKGWQGKYDEAFAALAPVLENDPENKEAISVKLDLLFWSGKIDEAQVILNNLIDAGNESADLYYRQAQIFREKLYYLRAYLRAKKALQFDRLHKPSKQLIEDTHLVAVFMTHTFEYTNLPTTPGLTLDPRQKFGYGVAAAAQVLPRSKWSGVITETYRYRYMTDNNQVGLGLMFRPTKNWDLALNALLGAPAEVVPIGVFGFSARWEMPPWIDISAAYSLDIEPWPRKEPAVLQRPKVGVGVKVIPELRFSAACTLGLLHYCSKKVLVTHIVEIAAGWKKGRLGINGSYVYGEETDKSDTGLVSPDRCDNFDTINLEYENTFFGLIGVQTHGIGVQVSWDFFKQLSLNLGYRIELRSASTNKEIVPSHSISLGGSSWF